jgi:hypothetical protein
MIRKSKRKPEKRKLRPRKRKTVEVRKGSLVEFFAKSPLRGAGIDLERLDDKPREIDL